jgi:hypothetical protein
MLKSEYNKGVLDNFVLWYTHKNREEITDAPELTNVLAKTLYEQINLYIENDHVDGIEGDDEGENIRFANGSNEPQYYCRDLTAVYTSDGIEIARSVVGDDGYEVRILQGMDRASTVAKILRDCPEWAEVNNLKSYSWPKLFTK